MKNVILLIIVVFLFSCEIFETRDPESPDGNKSNYTAAVSPEILFQNLKNSFVDKNVENYLKSFVDVNYLNYEFKFIPTSTAINALPIVSEWTLESEKRYFFNFVKINEKNKLTLKLENEKWNSNTPDSRTYVYDYIIENRTPQNELIEIFEGSSQFEIKLDSRNEWVIVTWLDFQSENKISWSELKGGYY